ncbi:MAG: hypothetical protein GF308_00200 [Candidatus Heimdallarchaeota archaeon]|nr:hypothetical protein [Candidatus Heimdallarchaeota archaeon]
MKNSKKVVVIWVEDVPTSEIYLNEEDLKALNIQKDELIEVTDEFIENSLVAKAYPSQEVQSGYCKVNRDFGESMGFIDGFDYQIKPYLQSLKEIDKVIINLEVTGEKLGLKEKLKKINHLLDEVVLGKGYTLYWPEEGLKTRITGTEPSLQSSELFRFDRTTHTCIVTLIEKPFNTILLLDISSSMVVTEDIDAKNATKIISAFTSFVNTNMQELAPFLKAIKNKSSIRRLDATILAILPYLQTISKRKNKKFGLITFAEKAEKFSISINNIIKPFFEISTFKGKNLSQYIIKILVTKFWQKVQKLGKRGMNLENALIEAVELANQMDIANPEDERDNTMIVLLTDGKYTIGRSPTEVVYKHIKDRPKTVVHVIGIGEADEDLYKAVAEYGHGSFKKFNDLNRLTKYLFSLLKNFRITYKAD